MSSPFKNILIDLSNTPAKNIVQYDINGWMETNFKAQKHQIRYRKNIKSYNHSEQLIKKKHNQIMNFQQLKRKKMKLLKNSTYKLSSNKKVLPNTASSNHENSINRKIALNNDDEFLIKFKPAQKKILSASLNKVKAPLKCFQIAEFIPKEDDKMKDHKNIRQFLASRQKKTTVIEKNNVFDILAIKAWTDRLVKDKNNRIQQQNLTKQNYKGLNFVSRKVFKLIN